MAEKRKVWRVKDVSGAIEQVLIETSAEQVKIADSADNFTSDNVEGALAEVAEMAKTGGVTGVKGAAETEYRKGNVNITPTDIGLDKVNNTADADKVVKEAGKTTYALHVVGNDSTNAEKSITFDGSANKEVAFNNGDFVTTLTGSNLQVAIADKGYATKTYVDTQDDKKLDKNGGTIAGNLSVNGGVTVGGNLTVNGTTTTIDSTTLQVKDKLIEVAHGNTTKLTSPAGLVVPKYDGTNSGALVFDGDGMAQVGKVVLDAAGNIDTTQSGLQTLATRTNLVGGNLVEYDSTNKTLVDSKKKVGDFALKTDIPTNYVTIDTQQIITGKKTFSGEIDVNQIKSILGTPICTMDNRDLHIGSFADTTYIRGGDGTPSRPQYEYQVSNGVVTKPIALVDDIKTTKVDNAVNADTATTASKVANQLTITLTDDMGGHIVKYDGSKSQTLNFIPTTFKFTRATTTSPMDIDLRDTGVSANYYYSAVIVDTKGRVTAGGQSIEWGTSGQTEPSGELMPGGLFFELQ